MNPFRPEKRELNAHQMALIKRLKVQKGNTKAPTGAFRRFIINEIEWLRMKVFIFRN